MSTDPQQGVDPEAVLARIRAKQTAVDPDAVLASIRAKQGPIDPRTTRHDGVPFVNAPEMANTHNGKAFVDADHDPSYLEGAAGRAASLGRVMGDNVQSGVRALIRDHGAREAVEEMGRSSSPLMDAMGPAGTVARLVNAVGRTPSFQRAHDEIQYAEGREDPTVTKALGVTGAAAQLAPLVESVPGMLRGVMSPQASPIPTGRFAGVRGLARRGVEGVRGLAFPTEKGLQGPMETALSGKQPNVAGNIPRTRSIMTARPQVGEPTLAPVEGLTGAYDSSIPEASGLAPDVQGSGDIPESIFKRGRSNLARKNAPRGTSAPVIPGDLIEAPSGGSVADLVKPQGQPSAVADAVKQAPRQRGPTAAQFQHRAETLLGAPPRPASLESMGLEGVEGTPIRPKPPKMYGDAEEAMGLAPEQQPDLMEQLSRSFNEPLKRRSGETLAEYQGRVELAKARRP